MLRKNDYDFLINTFIRVLNGELGAYSINKFMNFIFASSLTYTQIIMPIVHFYVILKISLKC